MPENATPVGIWECLGDVTPTMYDSVQEYLALIGPGSEDGVTIRLQGATWRWRSLPLKASVEAPRASKNPFLSQGMFWFLIAVIGVLAITVIYLRIGFPFCS